MFAGLYQGFSSVSTFIKGYTEGSALTVGRSDLGTLNMGMAADFVITDQDMLTIPMNDYPNTQDMLTTAANALPAIHILETWVAGKRVYQAKT